jgi:hypothetical protein
MDFEALRGSYVGGIALNVPPDFTPELLPFPQLHIHPTLVWPGLSPLHLLKLGNPSTLPFAPTHSDLTILSEVTLSTSSMPRMPSSLRRPQEQNHNHAHLPQRN